MSLCVCTRTSLYIPTSALRTTPTDVGGGTRGGVCSTPHWPAASACLCEAVRIPSTLYIYINPVSKDDWIPSHSWTCIGSCRYNTRNDWHIQRRACWGGNLIDWKEVCVCVCLTEMMSYIPLGRKFLAAAGRGRNRSFYLPKDSRRWLKIPLCRSFVDITFRMLWAAEGASPYLLIEKILSALFMSLRLLVFETLALLFLRCQAVRFFKFIIFGLFLFPATDNLILPVSSRFSFE